MGRPVIGQIRGPIRRVANGRGVSRGLNACRAGCATSSISRRAESNSDSRQKYDCDRACFPDRPLLMGA